MKKKIILFNLIQKKYTDIRKMLSTYFRLDKSLLIKYLQFVVLLISLKMKKYCLNLLIKF